MEKLKNLGCLSIELRLRIRTKAYRINFRRKKSTTLLVSILVGRLILSLVRSGFLLN